MGGLLDTGLGPLAAPHSPPLAPPPRPTLAAARAAAAPHRLDSPHANQTGRAGRVERLEAVLVGGAAGHKVPAFAREQ